MVIISEIISVTGLILRANGYIFRIPDNWYKGNSEIKSFKSDLSFLSQRAAQWETQLKQHGMSQDPVLTSFLAQASKMLDEEEEYYDAHRNSPVWKLRRKLFPGKLTYILEEVRKIVEAGPQLLREAVETDNLLAKRFPTRASELPFGYDPQYVPLQNAVEEVQKALEDKMGPQVVTLHGEPGMGKSALAKYVALLYQDMIWGSAASSFDSVQYLLCGRGCQASTKHCQLQRALLSNLGLDAILGTSEDGQDGEYSHRVSSHQSALRRVLRDRRALIILDDVWEEDFQVLACMISRGSHCRYLLTSQTQNVWHDALCIKMPTPTEAEALNIFYNHMRGYLRSADSHSLPGGCSSDSQQDVPSRRRHAWRSSTNTSLQASSSRSQPEARPEASSGNDHQWRLSSKEQTPEQTPYFEADLNGKIRELIRILESHPLSLVNIAVSVSPNGAVDANHMKNLTDNVFTFLDNNHHVRRILVNERPYSLTVSASMMLMVDSLRKAERDVLFLIALLRRDINWVGWRGRGRGAIPEYLVRFFIRRLYRGSASHVIFKCSSALHHLQDNSLVQVTTERDIYGSLFGNSTRLKRMSLSIHNLRREYIKQSHLTSLQGIAASIAAADLDVGGDHGLQGTLVNLQDSRQCLAIGMGVAYFDDAFAEELSLPFQSAMAHMSLNRDALGNSSGHRVGPGQELHSLAVSGVLNSNDVIPRGVDQPLDARELVRSAKNLWRPIGNPWFDKFHTIAGEAINMIMELINFMEDPKERWKQQVYFAVSKVMMKLLCRKELDDSSMASLLTIPHTMNVACVLFDAIYRWLYRDQIDYACYHQEQHEALSDMLPATWKALSYLVYSDNVNLDRRDHCLLQSCGKRPRIIECLLEFEPHDRVLVEFQRLLEVANGTSNSCLQNAIYDGVLSLHMRRLTWQMLSGSDLQELVLVILWKTIDDLEHVRFSPEDKHVYLYRRYMMFMALIGRDSGYVQKLLTVPYSWKEIFSSPSFFRRLLNLESLTIRHQDMVMRYGGERWPVWAPEIWWPVWGPVICQKWWKMLNDQHCHFPPAEQLGAYRLAWPTLLLSVLSGTLEFQAEAARVLNEAYWAEEDFASWPESCSMGLAQFWSNVALLPNLTDSVRLGLMTIAKCWMAELCKYNHNEIICSSFSSTSPVHVHCPCSKDAYDEFYRYCAFDVELLQRVEELAKAVTIISVLHNHTDSLLATEISTLEGSQERWTKSTLCVECAQKAGMLYVRICKGQMHAYRQMGMHDKALSYLDRAEAACSFVHAKWTSMGHTYKPRCKPELLSLTYLRSHGVLIQALSTDYTGAMVSQNRLEEATQLLAIERDHHWHFFMCTNRGVLSRLSGEFSKAVHEFDESLEHWNKMTSEQDRIYTVHTRCGPRTQLWGCDRRTHNFVKCRLLEHRCRAKELMQDFEGSKLDMEAAKGLRSSDAFLEPVTWRYTFIDQCRDTWIRTLEYSLPQLPSSQLPSSLHRDRD